MCLKSHKYVKGKYVKTGAGTISNEEVEELCYN